MLSTDKQTDRQTDRQTDKLTNATKNITSFAKEVIITRMLLLRATVKRFQFDLYVNLEGQQMLISSWFQK